MKPNIIPISKGLLFIIQSNADGNNQQNRKIIVSQIIGAINIAKNTFDCISFFDISESAFGIPIKIGSEIFADEKRPNRKPIGDHSMDIHPYFATNNPWRIQKNIPIIEYMHYLFEG